MDRFTKLALLAAMLACAIVVGWSMAARKHEGEPPGDPALAGKSDRDLMQRAIRESGPEPLVLEMRDRDGFSVPAPGMGSQIEKANDWERKTRARYEELKAKRDGRPFDVRYHVREVDRLNQMD